MLPMTPSVSSSEVDCTGAPPSKKVLATLFVNGRRVKDIALDPEHAAFPDEFPDLFAEANVLFRFFEVAEGGSLRVTKAAILVGRVHRLALGPLP